MAVSLERPLLVRGEPGTGKTLIAVAVAESLGIRLITWPVTSTTRPQDGLYVYDTVQRLYDSRFGEGNPADVAKYTRLRQLGESFAATELLGLVIDEVDKADFDIARPHRPPAPGGRQCNKRRTGFGARRAPHRAVRRVDAGHAQC